MGVDWMTCDTCSETFPDCGPYGHCICENTLCNWCFRKFSNEYGTTKTYDYGNVCCGCDTCKLIEPADHDVLRFALSKLNVSRGVLVDELRTAVAAGTYDTGRKTAKPETDEDDDEEDDDEDS